MILSRLLTHAESTVLKFCLSNSLPEHPIEIPFIDQSEIRGWQSQALGRIIRVNGRWWLRYKTTDDVGVSKENSVELFCGNQFANIDLQLGHS